MIEAEHKPNIRRRFFHATLKGKPQSKDLASFTVRFRSAQDESWKWIRDQTSLPDGQLCYQKAHVEDAELSKYFKNFNKDGKLEVKQERSQNAASVWTIFGMVDGAKGRESTLWTYKVGLPAGFSRFFALVRIWTPWLAPRHGRDRFVVDKDAILLSFLQNDGTHVVLLAVSGINDTLTIFRNDDEGNIVIHSRNDSKDDGAATIIIATAMTFEEANAAAVFQARRLVMRNSTAENDPVVKAMEEKDVKAEWLEEWFDGFSYCTWNGLGINLTEDRLCDALKQLRDNDINITNLIIDDNWQSLDHPGEGQPARRWMEFEANKEGFPNGLGHAVGLLRKQNPSLKHVAVWHALLGYWGAISPNGKLAKEYKTMEVRKTPNATGDSWTVIHPDDVMRFYNDFYYFLMTSGIDSVKTDAQFALDELVDAPDRRAMTKEYQDCWSIAMLRYFSARAISCMSQAPQILFHSQLPSNKPRLLVRNSDDFFPNVEDSHPWHIFCNAYNTLLNQHLNALPDWDMFQTSHPWAAFHGAARCVSGGPIYVTDTPGEHNIDLIHQMTAQTVRGNTIILRPSVIGKTTQPYVAYDEQRLLKISTYHGFARTGSSILGIFNVTQRSITEIVRLADFPGTEEGSYVLRSHVTGHCSKIITQGRQGFNYAVAELGVKGYDIITAHPVYGPYKEKDGKSGPSETFVANLGLVGKMSGAAAIVNTSISSDQNWTVRFWTSLKALGTLGEQFSAHFPLIYNANESVFRRLHN